jgi:hypothetical protein
MKKIFKKEIYFLQAKKKLLIINLLIAEISEKVCLTEINLS